MEPTDTSLDEAGILDNLDLATAEDDDVEQDCQDCD
jgi:hypothetical protein